MIKLYDSARYEWKRRILAQLNFYFNNYDDWSMIVIIYIYIYVIATNRHFMDYKQRIMRNLITT